MKDSRKIEIAKMTINSPNLLNITELAFACDVDRAFIGAMKKWGYTLPGGKNTIKSVHDWLKQNPDFQPSRVKGRCQAAARH